MGADYAPLDRLKLIPERVRAGLYIDLGHSIDDTTLVVSTGRSGSTWIAEIINHRNEYRLVFEPFRGDRVRRARPIRRGEYLDPHEQGHALSATIDALLSGRVRSWWTDAHSHRRLARARIVKEVRITNLLPWIRARHPGLRIVYAVRDPIEVARSWLELGWGDDLDEVLAHEQLLERFAHLATPIDEIASRGDLLERHVLRWCLENAIPLTSHAQLDLHLVVYERLRAEPLPEVERLFTYLGRDATGAEASVRRPSATAAFPRVREVTFTHAQRDRAREIVSLFGLTESTPIAD